MSIRNVLIILPLSTQRVSNLVFFSIVYKYNAEDIYSAVVVFFKHFIILFYRIQMYIFFLDKNIFWKSKFLILSQQFLVLEELHNIYEKNTRS